MKQLNVAVKHKFNGGKIRIMIEKKEIEFDQEYLIVEYLRDLNDGIILIEVLPRNTQINILSLLSDNAKEWIKDQL